MLPEAIQAAAETAKQGISFTATIPVAALSSFLSVLVLKVAEMLINRRRNGRADRAEKTEKAEKAEKAEISSSKPGDGETCKDHGLAIERHETEIKNMNASLERIHKENREDHNRLFEKLDILLLRRPQE